MMEFVLKEEGREEKEKGREEKKVGKEGVCVKR